MGPLQLQFMESDGIPLLSRIEHNERVRRLPFTRRILYHVMSSAAVTLVFIVLAGLATLVVSLLWDLLIGKSLNVGDTVIIALPVIFALMISIGFSSSPMPNHITPGDTLGNAVRRAARRGLINGMITGFVFSIIWSLAVNLSRLYAHIITIYDSYIPLDEILIQSFIIMVVVGIAFALFRSFTCLNGHFILQRLQAEQ